MALGAPMTQHDAEGGMRLIVGPEHFAHTAGEAKRVRPWGRHKFVKSGAKHH